MTIRVTHAKVNQIEDWTQAKLNEYINAGLYPQGTTIADITQPSDWNDDHSSTDLDILELNVRGTTIINMANDNYTMSESEARNSVVIIQNSGVSKTLTIPSYSTNASRFAFYILNGGPIKIVSADSAALIAHCYTSADVAYAYGSGVVGLYNAQTCDISASSVTTAGNTNEQIIRSTLLPVGFIGDGHFLEVAFNAKKSGTSATETFRLRIGTAGTTADTQVWSNAAMTGATDNVSAMVRIYRISATSVIVQTITNALSPFGSTATDFAAVTVANIDSNGLVLSLTGQHSDGTETATNYTYLARTGR